MADFNFNPPQQQLFGGVPGMQWEPLGQENQLKNYRQELGYELYSKAFTNTDTDGIRVSVLGDPRREALAEQAFNAFNQNTFSGASGFGSNPVGQGQQMSAFQNNNAYPNWGGTPPVASVGGSPLDISQFSPQMQQQIWSQMGGGMGSDSQSVSDATEALSKISKVLKEELTPATKEYTEKVGSLVGIMRGDGSGGSFSGGGGGFGGGSGFGGGGITPYNGNFNSGWWDGEARPEVLGNYGIGNGMPRFSDRDFEEDGGFFGAIGKRLGNPDRLAYSLRRSRIAMTMIAQPAFEAADEYRGQMASQDIMGVQSGMMNYGDLMNGEYGQLTRRATNAQETRLAFGRQVDMAYGGFADMALGPNVANGPLGAAAGIGAPAAGFGLAAATLTGSALAGGVVGAGVAIAGTIGYAASAGQDPYEIGRWQEARANGERVSGDTFRGAVGQAASTMTAVLNPDGSDTRNLNIRANARDYFNNVNAFAAGNMSTGDLKSWANQNNFNPAVAVGAGYDTFLSNNANNYGWSRDEQMPVLGLDLKYNPQGMPKSNQMFGMQMALGGGQYASFMDKFLPNAAGAMGVDIGNQAGMNDLMGMYTTNMYNVQQSGGNVDLYQQQLQQQLSPIQKLNQSRYRAGYGSVLGLDNYSALSGNPYIQSDVQDIDEMRYGYQASDPGFAQNVADPLLNRASYYSRAGKPAISGRIQNMMPQLNQMYDEASSYGADISEALRGYSSIASTDPQQGAVINKIASGDRLALSQNAAMLGDMRYQTMNTTTGMGIRYQNMGRDQYDIMRQDQPDMFRLSYDQAQGGEKAWTQRIHDLGRGLDQFQFQQATAERNIGYQMQTGGAMAVNAQGFAVSSDGLNGLSQLFQSQGMQLQTGNGMGMWQVQDSMTLLSRQQQQNSLDTAGTRNALSNQQWNESFAMNQQQFNLSTDYQRSSMNTSRSQQVVSEGWKEEDLALGRNRMELNYGWQMEDYDRNIRFARGRQRQDLMREQERATISHSMDETQQGNQEERFKTESQWNKEEFDKKKAYFEQSKTLAQQEMDMNKRHHDEMQNLTTQEHEKQKQFQTQQWALEDQRRLLDRQNEELQYKMSTDMSIAVKKVTDETNLYKDALSASSTQTTEVAAKIALMTTNMSLFVAAVNGFLGVSTSGGGSAAPYTTSASHRNDPTQDIASPAASGGAEKHLSNMVGLLQQIVSMGPGRVNATIYTNDNSVKTGSLYQKSLARVQ